MDFEKIKKEVNFKLKKEGYKIKEIVNNKLLIKRLKYGSKFRTKNLK